MKTMPQQTIAIVFDFDDTLAPDATSALLASLGVEPEAFWKEVAELLRADWDPVPAYLFKMIEISRQSRATAISKSTLHTFGSSISFYRGALTLKKHLTDYAQSVFESISLEFYIVSSGIGEMIRASKFAKHCTHIWACDFHYNTEGCIEFPKNIVSFTDKTRYLFQISKGIIGAETTGQPFAVNKSIAPAELRVPFDQMIYVGDGYTDIPCFSLVKKQGGIAFGVYDPKHTEKWARAWGYVEDNRVSNLAPADYGKDAALMHNLCMAVHRIASNIKLRETSYQG
ncbi:MAG: haloacid dehalogenase-like hydrolase [Bdellovibrionales bacterium]|nr:haloacid dehalogenase-like hydrolase [Bdellovibrionales bacterium]